MQDNSIGIFFLIFIIMLPVVFTISIIGMYLAAKYKNRQKKDEIKIDKEAL